jgi:hypothetical protein
MVIGPLAGHTAVNALATGAIEAAGDVLGAGSKGRLATGSVTTGEAAVALAAFGGATRNTCPTSTLLGSLMAFHN